MPNTFQGLLSFPEFSGNDLDSTSRSDLVFQFHTILNNLSIQLCCPICQDVPTQPYLLPTCGHTFCYSCIKHWFQCNPSCPICRSIIGETKPILNHSVKNIIVALIDDISLTAKKLHLKDYKSYKQKLESWEKEKNEEFSIDKANDFPWLKKIASNWGRAVVDTEDGVPRCSACHWELVDGHCENCGRTMVGWQDRTDGDELDDDDDDDDEENEGGYGRGPRRDRALHSDSDDWEDYDNGLNDMHRRIVDNEAEETSGEEGEGDDSNNDAYRRGSHNDRRGHDHGRETGYIDAYDSDDGFVVDDDEEKEEEDNDDDNGSEDDEYVNTSDVEIVDEDKLASGDEDVILHGNAAEPLYLSDDESDGGLINPRRSRALPVQSDDDDETGAEEEIEVHDDNDDSDGDDDVDDDDFLKTVRSGRKKAILDDEDEDEDDNNGAGDNLSSDDLIPSKNHSSSRKIRKKRRIA